MSLSSRHGNILVDNELWSQYDNDKLCQVGFSQSVTLRLLYKLLTTVLLTETLWHIYSVLTAQKISLLSKNKFQI